MKKRILALIVAVTFVLGGCGTGKPNGELDKFADELVVGQDGNVEKPTVTTAPTETPSESESAEYYLTFEATTIDGEAWNSDKFADSKMTMINVWGTYCNPCLSEMPDLGEIASEYDASEFQLIGVICDVMEGDSEDALGNAKALIEETKAAYPHLLLNESLYVSFMGAVSAVPTTFFVRQDGSLIGYLTGAQSKENWKALIDELLAEEQ